jgi:hypothetical protein
MNYIGDMGKLEVLHLTGAKTKICKLEYLTKLRSLWSLNFIHSSISDDDIETLSRIENLRDVSFCWTQITSRGISFLANHPNLESIDVSHSMVDKSCIKYLMQIPKLKEIYAEGVGIKKELFVKHGWASIQEQAVVFTR